MFAVLFTLLFKYYVKNDSYDLQLGYSQNQELPGLVDNGTKFENKKTLIALAIYPDKKNSLGQAQIYVTKKGDSKILQTEQIREYADLAAFEMRMSNLKWGKGEYTLYFKRGENIVKQLDFVLY
ncbi:hypothetical protein D3C76_1397880 [compost metagenome]